jgi:hypothetical protein
VKPKIWVAGVAYARTNATPELISSSLTRAFREADISRFAGIVLDESGIIKSHDGKTRAILTEACRDIPWRLAVPQPQRRTTSPELGQHASSWGDDRQGNVVDVFCAMGAFALAITHKELMAGD